MSADVIVHIVDDEEPVRKSLAFLLTMSDHAVRVHESATAFLAIASGLDRACLVTDLRMPDMSGVELLKKLREQDAMLPTIVITGHADVPMAVEAMKAGALDFIEKPFEDEVLLEAIARAIGELGKQENGGHDSGAVRERMTRLSEREQQVMTGIVAGLPNKTIAYDLDISPRTVEVHRANVMAKMQARNLPELVRMVMAAKTD
ncbi:response regulator [Chelativorans sp. ZYF759]|uniref:response regulator FixJ n=1 Tax=Chelativorans sp. ZYF759 TaxID=2692213 RepID=UPI00145F6844|nr:response regulator FixJ [Chelativorans sp. ZYF759]NMG40650.1 response regulator [Chelativorans sp. ZYF759]